jgi:plasmid stability protein
MQDFNPEAPAMPTMTVRNLPDEVHRRLRLHAAELGISTEEAARRILDEATRPPERLGDVVAAFARARGVDFPDAPRARTPIAPADFG